MLFPSHFVHIGGSVGNYESYETPLGKIKVNTKICEELIKDEQLGFSPDAHQREHSLEVQLPFLCKSLKKFQIIPVLLGDIPAERLAGILEPYFNDDDSLFVISTDLSHYKPYSDAIITDKHSLNIITSLNTKLESEIDACGQKGVKVAMRLAQKHNCEIKLLDYRNSGDTAGDKSGVVGYASLAINKI